MNQKVIWNRFFFITACLAQGLYGAISMCAAVLLNAVANSVGTAATTGELLRVGIPAIGFAVIYGGSRAVSDSVTQIYAERAGENLRSRLNRSIFSMDSAGFAKKDTGDYLNIINGDVLLVRDQYYAQVPLMVCYVIQFAFCVIYSFYLNPVVAAVLIIMSVVQYFAPMLFGKKINELMLAQSQMTGSFTSKTKELLLGFSVIKSYGAEGMLQDEFDRSNHIMTKSRERAAIMTQLMMSTNLTIAWFMILLSIVVSGYFVIQGAMPTGTILTVFYIANRYSMPVIDFAAAYTKAKGSRGVREKLEHFLYEHPLSERSNGISIVEELELRNLSFSYDGTTPALDGITFTFEAGKKYLLLGESGCGKSTLLKLLAGQYPAQGILMDGRPLANPAEDISSGQMILVGQQPYVFRRSVAENIDFLQTGDRNKLTATAEQCCLSDFLSTLPHGIDTLVDEEQRQLSGGQKARIGLARAVYAEPKVLLLDEVTSALDSDTACKIEQMLLQLPDTMVIHIAHKPSQELMKQYDAVLTMESGKITHVTRQ